MATIWKFPIPIEDKFSIAMPRDAELLFVATQNEQGCIWARVVAEHSQEERTFLIRGTGHEVNTDCKHVGSFILRGGALVFHLFEVDRVTSQDR